MKKNFQSGFTLIEVIVAMSIFSFIAMATATAIGRGMAVKKRAEREWDETHGIRTAMNFLTRDISLAFHVKKPAAEGAFFTQDHSRWFKTYFNGRSDQLHFTSLSNRRLYDNTHESEGCEVGYALISSSEKERDSEKSGQYSLSRRKSPIIDEDQEKGGEPFILIEHIKEVQFKYYSQKKDRWFEEWDTSKRDTEDRFPEAVEIKLIVLQNQKEIEYSTKIMVANPNNEELQPQGQTP
ncbi:MAG: prepilin-type N-terminal cleavage/methylation domain-containing protein [Deltaproteobacteria bacterium]|nr:prepilin-type N-terminal cleavage/methylation domain-containing protein [Deltaproteobacteria bacterium]